ncbi:hypothetical protein DZS_01030 [Dickeya ananatis]
MVRYIAMSMSEKKQQCCQVSALRCDILVDEYRHQYDKDQRIQSMFSSQLHLEQGMTMPSTHEELIVNGVQQ